MADPITLTADERALLRVIHHDLGYWVAWPDHAWVHNRDGTAAGGGGGFWRQWTRNGVQGTWHEWLVAATKPDGTPTRWHRGKLLREVRISYARLTRWCESLPAPAIAQARAYWNPSHRDIDALNRLVLALLADPAPPPPPYELTLFDLPQEPAHA
ncbi:hypothetical protein [Nocardia puris]|uniref:Uncharacterized protein n=1 Tax=Nocardia puris TaxID=208602 RepID=A0A366DC22_9NOCA|nr:hypothetical protein [Nocardia puris]RBO87566.1 hypothetical protein DFR74_111273 [Nocardia puris]